MLLNFSNVLDTDKFCYVFALEWFNGLVLKNTIIYSIAEPKA